MTTANTASDPHRSLVGADYLQAAAALFAPIKTRSYQLMGAGSGARVLDVGCGPGVDTLALAGRVGTAGRVLGVDQDGELLALARQRARQAGLAGRVWYTRQDAARLAVADAAMDGCRAERVFMHLPAPARVLAEMVRVTRPGGRVVVVEPDWASLSVDSEETDTERVLARVRAAELPSGYAGRGLYRGFRKAGLDAIHVEMVPLHFTDPGLWEAIVRQAAVEAHALETGAVSAAALARWREANRRAAAAGVFFASASVILMAGRRPG